MNPYSIAGSGRSPMAGSSRLAKVLFVGRLNVSATCFAIVAISRSPLLKRNRNTRPSRTGYNGEPVRRNPRIYGSLMREMARKQSSSTTSRARKQRAAHIRSPENLWQRFRKGKSLIDDTQVQQLLTPINFTLRQGERYAF